MKTYRQEEASNLKDLQSQSFKTIALSDIQEMICYEKSHYLVVRYTSGGRKKSEPILLADISKRVELAKAIGDLQGMKQGEAKESLGLLTVINLGLFALIAFVTWSMRSAAIAAENGESIELARRRNQWMLELAEKLGPNLITVIGGALMVYYLYKLVRRFVNPIRGDKFTRV